MFCGTKARSIRLIRKLLPLLHQFVLESLLPIDNRGSGKHLGFAVSGVLSIYK